MPENVAGSFPDNNYVVLSFQPSGVNAAGQTVQLPLSSISNPAWALTSGASVTITPSADNTNCEALGVAGTDGDSVVTLTGVNSAGTALTTIYTLTTVAGVIVAINLNPVISAPQPLPAPSV